MKLAYFPGCKISFYLNDYDLSFRAVMAALDVELVALPFNCCGYPARGESLEISILSSVKNLALARAQNLDIITPCKCCFGQFRHAEHWYTSDLGLRSRIDNWLLEENLSWDGQTRVMHLLDFLTGSIGLDRLEKRITRKLNPRTVAVQYGCHALRPFSITHFDNPVFPRIFEQVLGLTGLRLLDWSRRTECCGNPIQETLPELAQKLLKDKFESASREGADLICTACTHCQMQYEPALDNEAVPTHGIDSVLVTQLLGLALGCDPESLAGSKDLSHLY